MGVHPISSDIKGLGWFSVRAHHFPSCICFRCFASDRRFASHAFSRVLPLPPSRASRSLGTKQAVTRGRQFMGAYSRPCWQCGKGPFQYEFRPATSYAEHSVCHFTLRCLENREKRLVYYTTRCDPNKTLEKWGYPDARINYRSTSSF